MAVPVSMLLGSSAVPPKINSLAFISDYQNANISLKLPTELWREIFVHATQIPGGFDSPFISPFEFSDITDGYTAFLKRLSSNHRTKQTLCLVSKKWRSVAQELIFDYLFLQDNFNWTTLADGLEASRRNDEERGGHGAGWYVKRLEICTFSWTEDLGLAAARVIRCCPNVRILTVGAHDESGGIPVGVVAAVFDSCPRAIRSLDWTCDLGPVQTELMFRLLPRAAGLQSLFMCVQQEFEKGQDLKSLSNVELPRLHTLELVSPDNDPSRVLNVVSHWVLPALRQVVLCGQAGIDDVAPFFEEHGPRIQTLEFDYLGEHHGEVLRLCTHLTELVVHVHWAHIQVHGGHPKVQRVGLRGLHLLDRGQPEQSAAVQSLKIAFPLFLDRKKYPEARLVRLLDFDKAKFRSQQWRACDVAFWAFWVKRFERVGVRLEDHEGNLITVVFSEMNVLLPEDTPGCYMRSGARWRVADT